jgi:putative transcription factor
VRCEVCGRKIHSDPIRANIEGAKLTVCVECSKHGKVIYPDEENPPPRSPFLTIASSPGTRFAPASSAAAAKTKRQPQMMQKKRQLIAKVEITQELVDGYAQQIRVAREKLGLSHEDLGLKISEKATVLKHVELGKMEPNNLLVSKLERILKIKLLVPIETETPEQKMKSTSAKNEEMTLGDLIEIDSNDSEEPKERKQS